MTRSDSPVSPCSPVRRVETANLFFILFALTGGSVFGYLFWEDFYTSLARQNRAPIARITGLVNRVQRQYTARTIWETARSGLPLYDQDKIRTASGASVRITMNNGDTIELGGNSLIAITHREDGSDHIFLERGALRSVTATGGLTIQTSAGIETVKTGVVYPLTRAVSRDDFSPLLASAAQEEPLARVVLEPVIPAPFPAPEPPADAPAPAAPAPAAPALAPAPAPVPVAAPVPALVEPPAAALPDPVLPGRGEPVFAAPALPRRLPAPTRCVPQDRSVLDKKALALGRGVWFSWDPAPGADAYRWALETAGVVVRSLVVTEPFYHETELAIFLTGGDYVWTVQAQRTPVTVREDLSPLVTNRFRVVITPIPAPVPKEPVKQPFPPVP